MTLPSGGKRNWLLPIAASLLLHVPVVILLSLSPPVKTIAEPELKLSLRPAPPTQKASPRLADARPAGTPAEPAPLARQPVETKKTPNPNPAAGQSAERENAPLAESGVNRRETAPEQTGRTSPDAAGGGAPHAGPVELGSLKIIKEVIPDYPAFSRKRGEEGEAGIIVTIKDGTVTAAEVYKSSGSKRLDQSALRAAKQWRFAEAENVRAVIPFVFSLTD